MASTGFTLPGAAFSFISGSGRPWTNPSNICTDNTAVATAAMQIGDTETRILVGYNFDFSSIPDDSTIDGIEIRVRHRAASANTNELTMTKYFIVATGATPKNDVGDPLGTSNRTDTFGSATDLWGLTPTAAQIKAGGSNLGVHLQYEPVSGFSTISIEAVWMNVHYTPPGEDADGAFSNPALTMAGDAEITGRAANGEILFNNLTLDALVSAIRNADAPLLNPSLVMESFVFRTIFAESELDHGAVFISAGGNLVYSSEGGLFFFRAYMDAFAEVAEAGDGDFNLPEISMTAGGSSASASNGILTFEPLEFASQVSVSYGVTGELIFGALNILSGVFGSVEFATIDFSIIPFEVSGGVDVSKSADGAFNIPAFEVQGDTAQFVYQEGDGEIIPPSFILGGTAGTISNPLKEGDGIITFSPLLIESETNHFTLYTSDGAFNLIALTVDGQVPAPTHSIEADSAFSLGVASLLVHTNSTLNISSAFINAPMEIAASGIRTINANIALGFEVPTMTGQARSGYSSIIDLTFEPLGMEGDASLHTFHADGTLNLSGVEVAGAGIRIVNANVLISFGEMEIAGAIDTDRFADGILTFGSIKVLGAIVDKSILFPAGVAYRVVNISHSENGTKILSVEAVEMPVVSNV